jgi:Domain of unknown function (DUF5664)
VNKDTNPKDAVGIRKVPISTLPCGPMLTAGLAMLEGARKYGRHNYREAGVRASVYYDAVVGRHIMPWWEGQDIDPDSGLNHIDKAIAGLFVLRDSMLKGNWVDDRPIRNVIDLNELNAKAAEIIDRYPDAKAPCTEVKEVQDEKLVLEGYIGGTPVYSSTREEGLYVADPTVENGVLQPPHPEDFHRLKESREDFHPVFCGDCAGFEACQRRYGFMAHELACSGCFVAAPLCRDCEHYNGTPELPYMTTCKAIGACNGDDPADMQCFKPKGER